MASTLIGKGARPDPGAAAQAYGEALEARGLAVAEVNPGGSIVWASPAFLRFFSDEEEPLAGAPLSRIWAPTQQLTFENAWNRAREKGSFEWQAVTPFDGKPRRWRLTMRRDGGNGFLWIENRNAEGVSVDAVQIDRLRELNRMRIHFINTAAHEFATPLTPLRLQTTLLLEERLGPLTDKQRRSVVMLDRNMERLGQLVRDVLDVSRIEAGRFQVRQDQVDLADLGRHAVDSVAASAQQAGVELAFDGPTSLTMKGDKDRLTQVFLNLLTNAVKFTPQGGRIGLSMVPGEGRVTVSVTDTGHGIPSDKMDKLFQPFSQVHDTTQVTRPGTGLGLSICQGIIAQHGGRIWAESAGLGMGSKFAFVLPLDAAAPLDPATLGPQTRQKGGVGSRGKWRLFFFKCPECGSRDIDVRLIKNRYDCNNCQYSWK